MRAPDEVIAYHGCHSNTAYRVLSGEPFVLSSNPYDWPGTGIYFWEYGPDRAWDWAETRFKLHGTVIEARIKLGRCLNLLDVVGHDRIREANTVVAEQYRNSGRTPPANLANKQHFLDCAIIDMASILWERNGGVPFQTIRGCFPEGKPLYKGSKFLRETHVQIAVRDQTCISDLRQL